MSAIKRLTKEWDVYSKTPPLDTYTLCLVENKIDHWVAVIIGPDGTPYEGGAFFIDIKFPSDYPFKPPKLQFTTKIYHPNVKSNGLISSKQFCSDCGYQWSPAIVTTTIINQMIDLLKIPDATEHCVADVAYVYNTDRPLFYETAR